MTFLLQLFLAHLLGDFFLQNNKWIASKETLKWGSPYLYIHALVHFALILLVTWNIDYWLIAFIIMLLHLIIDGIKLQFQQPDHKLTWFLGDQVAHIIVLMVAWAFQTKIRWHLPAFLDAHMLIVIIAALFVLRPASLLTKITISRWTPHSIPSQSITVESLKDAGEWIGYLERLMILVFILLNKWEGVGFLLAAKSVFRFGDLTKPRETKLTEYVVIGTFLSFFIAIMTGLLAGYLLNIY